MSSLLSVDWETLFVPSGSLVEIVLRGTLTYLLIFILLRVVLKRQTGMLNTNDMLVIVLLADAAQNGMAGEYKSITEGILLVATIVFWSHVIEWTAFKSPKLQRLIKPRPLRLIKDGKLIKENMKHELLAEEELRSKLRKKGIEDLSTVKEAYIETDGRMSAIL